MGGAPIAPASSGTDFYNEVHDRREKLMGSSGPRALLTNWKVLRVAAFAAIGGLLYGYNQGVFSGVLAMENFKVRMGEWDPIDPDADQSKKGWLTAILELGAWVGTLLSPFSSEVLSRRYSIMAAVVIFLVGVVAQSVTPITTGPGSVLAGRFITGLGIGLISCIVPVYASEVSPAEIRGSMVALYQFSIVFGIMISYWINFGCDNITDSATGEQSVAAWLVPTTLQIFPALVLLIGMIWMPPSPRWLIHHGHEQRAKEVLSHLRDIHVEHELLELEFLEVKAQSLFEKRIVAEKFPHLTEETHWNTFKLQFVAWKHLFESKSMFKRVIVATVIMFFQQFTGINAILYYAPQIFQQLGLSNTSTSLLATGVVGVVMTLATIPAVLYIDKLGRKPVLIVGAIGMAFSHFVVAGILGSYGEGLQEHKAAGWAAITFIWLFVSHFGYSWGPACWIVVSEVWPLSSRAAGAGLGASSNWMNNFIIGQVTPIMLNRLYYGTYIFFGCCITLGACFVYFVVPETKRVSLEEMDILFGSEGTSQRDFETMAEINQEIGLTEMIRAIHGSGTGSGENVTEKGVEVHEKA